MNARGQAAIEFLLLFGFMIVVFTVFMVLIQQRTAVREEESNTNELARIGDAIYAEALLASRVHDGYERIFRLPLSLSQGTYTVTLAPTVTPSEIIISDSYESYVVFLPINLTTGSTIEPGLNSITRNNGVATMTALAPSGTVCEENDDCAVGSACQNRICVPCVDADDDGYYATSSVGACGGDDCDDGDEAVNPGIDEGDFCSDEIDNDCDGLIDVDDGACLVCTLPQIKTVYFAGGTTLATGGVTWDARSTGSHIEMCCNTNTQCAIDNGTVEGCASYGLVSRAFITIPSSIQASGYATDREWVCANMTTYGLTPTGQKLFHCTSANDGALISNSTHGFCCSRYTNATQTEYYGTWGFNAGFQGGVNKGENLSVAGSCSDVSDNDCDGKRDGYDDLCWNALLNSTCGGNTAFENLTAYPNSTMPGIMDYTTRFVYDWRVGSASLAVHQYTFDIADDAGLGMTIDHASSRANMTTLPAKNQDPLWVLSDDQHRGLLVFDGVDDWTNVTTAPPSGAYSIELWVRPDSTADSNIITLSALDPLTTYSHQVRIKNVPGFIDTYQFAHYLWDGGARTVTSTASYNPGGWHHVVATATPSGTMRLYVDGVETGIAVAIGTPYGGGTRWILGAATGGGSGAYGGSIDEVRIYHRALSATQVKSLFTRGYSRVVSQELVVGENWDTRITPTNGTHHGLPIISNAKTVAGGPSACDPCACEQPDKSCAGVGDVKQDNECAVCSLTGWVDAANGDSCGDGLACNGVDTCQSGSCTAGFVVACEDTTPYCIEPSGACVQCTQDADCESRCAVEVTKSGVDVVFYPGSSCKANACEAVTSEICTSGASAPADVSLWCHGPEDGKPSGCCGQLGFDCPPSEA